MCLFIYTKKKLGLHSKIGLAHCLMGLERGCKFTPNKGKSSSYERCSIYHVLMCIIQLPLYVSSLLYTKSNISSRYYGFDRFIWSIFSFLLLSYRLLFSKTRNPLISCISRKLFKATPGTGRFLGSLRVFL